MRRRRHAARGALEGELVEVRAGAEEAGETADGRTTVDEVRPERLEDRDERDGSGAVAREGRVDGEPVLDEDALGVEPGLAERSGSGG